MEFIIETADPTPANFPARLYEIGDRWAFTVQPDAVYEIFGRKVDGSGVIQFAARRTNEPGGEPVDYDFTFPAELPISARRRIRKVNAPCMICKASGFHVVNTAYSTYENRICDKH